MIQEYSKYTEEDHQVWNTLFTRQQRNLQTYGTEIYLKSLDAIAPAMNAQRVPRFEELDALLMKASGWSIEVVPGLIPVKEFFELLAKRRWCASTWLRKMSQLDYLEEPDMFHDVFGHIPVFMDKAYADFVQQIGALGVKYIHDDEIVEQLKRVYWFTVEFGLKRSSESAAQPNRPKIYGAGLISSFGETNHIYEDPIEIFPFDIQKVMETPFINSEIQNTYFEIESYTELYVSIAKMEAYFSALV